jgi:hypothetical protein
MVIGSGPIAQAASVHDGLLNVLALTRNPTKESMAGVGLVTRVEWNSKVERAFLKLHVQTEDGTERNDGRFPRDMRIGTCQNVRVMLLADALHHLMQGSAR